MGKPHFKPKGTCEKSADPTFGASWSPRTPLRRKDKENPGQSTDREKIQSQNMHCQKVWEPGSQNRTSEISDKCAFRNSGTPVRRTKRRKSPTVGFQEFWDSPAQNKTSEISKNALSNLVRLQFAEQNIGNLKKCTFKNYGTPVRRTKASEISKNVTCVLLLGWVYEGD